MLSGLEEPNLGDMDSSEQATGGVREGPEAKMLITGVSHFIALHFIALQR